MSRKQYEGLLENPNVRTMLNLIAQAEGVKWGYNTLFGNQKIDNLAAHPNLKKQFKQTDGKINYTTAAGRYQFLKPTWDGLQRQLGLSDFSPRSQDIGAIALLAENGALPYVLKGDFQNAVKRSGGTWASLPSSNYAQPKRGWDFVNKHLGTSISSEQKNPAQFTPNFVDLKSVGIGENNKPYQPEMVDLASVGIKSQGNNTNFQPEFVDLRTVGIG
ncbi:glycoside hydrolase family 104 protein [Acinetobacter haemolyticus]|uniref:glycoside hydrolase family 24 protein n=1 Tax=Acinetobacter haemolyticus TaxID=29430 RepID=UPI002A6A6C1F|nr:glycoside hydrolase family 104 protein [Acinetobacter haemolyticus]WPO68783.1 glycoside hydrolase family 104 protein [Acinetobacter haemolyticus]